MDTGEKLLARFPKRRPELPEAYRRIYLEHYRSNRDGLSTASAAAKWMESWMHRKVAEDTIGRAPGYSTLEIGAGTLNHLQYEPMSNRYDIVEPFFELFVASPLRRRIQNVYSDLQEGPHIGYDRVISIAAFEHLCNLPSIVARCGILLSERGQLRVAVPSEGTILWLIGWKLTTGIEFRLKHGLDYGVLMKHEHVNTADEIASVLRFFFKEVRRSFLGVAPALSFYQFCECSNPNQSRCADYLSSFDLTM